MSDPGKLDDFISSPLFLKILSVIIAFSFWFYATGSRTEETTRTMTVPVEYVNAPPQTTLKTAVREAQISLTGPQRVLSSIEQDSVYCEVDARGLSVGQYRLAVHPVVPKNVTLTEVKPTHVDIELVRFVERLVPVEVVVEKELPAGLYLDMVEVVPKNVSVRGSEKDLAKIGSARITPTMEELRASGELTLEVTLVQSAEFEDDVVVEPRSVRLRAVLAEGLPKKDVPVSARIVGKPTDDYRLKAVVVEPAMVTVEGPLVKLNALKKIDTETIDITDISKEQSMVIPLRMPEDPLLKVIGTTSVQVNVLLTPFTVTRLMSGLSVAVEGRSVYPGWTVEPEAVSVTIEGISSEMNALESKELLVQPYVNVTNLVSRRLTVPVLVRNSAGGRIRVVKVEPERVTVIANVQ